MQTQNTFTSILVMAALMLPTFALAQMPGTHVATVKAITKPAVVARGGHGTLLVTVVVLPGFHINAARPSDPVLIPTVFTSHASKGVTFGAAHYPAPKLLKVSFAKAPMPVYTGTAVIAIPFTVSKTAKPGAASLSGDLSFQGCNATSCYPPSSAPVRASVTIK